MVVDSDMPEQDRAETFRECGKCSWRLELPFRVRDQQGDAQNAGVSSRLRNQITASLSVWMHDSAAV